MSCFRTVNTSLQTILRHLLGIAVLILFQANTAHHIIDTQADGIRRFLAVLLFLFTGCLFLFRLTSLTCNDGWVSSWRGCAEWFHQDAEQPKQYSLHRKFGIANQDYHCTIHSTYLTVQSVSYHQDCLLIKSVPPELGYCRFCVTILRYLSDAELPVCGSVPHREILSFPD